MKNRFEKLSIDSDSATTRYEAFIRANNETTKHLIPIKKKGKRESFANHPDIVNARRILQKKTEQYHINKSRKCREAVNETKNCYTSAMKYSKRPN